MDSPHLETLFGRAEPMDVDPFPRALDHEWVGRLSPAGPPYVPGPQPTVMESPHLEFLFGRPVWMPPTPAPPATKRQQITWVTPPGQAKLPFVMNNTHKPQTAPTASMIALEVHAAAVRRGIKDITRVVPTNDGSADPKPSDVYTAVVIEVCDYSPAMMVTLRLSEPLYAVKSDYLDNHHDLLPKMRKRLLDWIVCVWWRFSMCSETLIMTVSIIDRFTAAAPHEVSRTTYQLLGIVAVWIAAKKEELYVPPIGDLRYLCENSYSSKEIIDYERKVCLTLNFMLTPPCATTFIRWFSMIHDSQFAIHTIAKYLVTAALISLELLKYYPSELAAAAEWIGLKCRAYGPWSADFIYYTGYTEDDLRPCCRDLVTYVKTLGPTDAVYRLFNGAQFYRASKYVGQILSNPDPWVTALLA